MRLTRQAAFIIALVCGFIAAGLVWYQLSRDKPVVEPVVEQVQVPVPIQDIPAQSDLRPDMFEFMSIEKEKVPSGALMSMDALQGRISIQPLKAGQPVLGNQVAERSARLGLTYGIPTGMRGMTVALDVVGVLSGFVKPGNRVDVLAAFESEGHFVVRTIAQNIEVLAVETQTTVAIPAETDQETSEGQPARRRGELIPVTLAVTPHQAQVIMTSDMAGQLRFVLRPFDEESTVPLEPSNSWSLVGPVPSKDTKATTESTTQQQAPMPPWMQPGPQTWGGPPTVAPAPTPTPAPKPAPKKPSVEIIRGGEREVVTPD